MTATTLLRTPRMSAVSGVWLEGFSKREAQAALIVLPWAGIVCSLLFYGALYGFGLAFPSLLEYLEDLEAAAHFCLFLACLLYLPLALLCEGFCCRRTGPRRSPEGWLALLPLVLAVLCCFENAHTHSQHSLRTLRGLTCGAFRFRLAAAGEFLLQLSWLWAADRLRRLEGEATPRFKRWFYAMLLLLWFMTLFSGPWEGAAQASGDEEEQFWHFLGLCGIAARVLIFLHCLGHVCGNRAHQCCCGCLHDWRVLENEPCSPGRRRLRQLTYYLLVRPQFLLLVHLPLGYPLPFLASFACTVRCGFALLLAVILRPAPWAAIGEHAIEEDTRLRFDAALSLRLWEYANETYLAGPPPPPVLRLEGCNNAALNGQYELRGAGEKAAASVSIGCVVYEHVLPEDVPYPVDEREDVPSSSASAEAVEAEPEQEVAKAGARVFLRRSAEDEWEISPTETPGGLRWAFVKSGASLPHWVAEHWHEVGATAGEASEANVDMALNLPVPEGSLGEGSLSSSPGLVPRRFEKRGGCPEQDVQWILAEEEGSLTDQRKLLGQHSQIMMTPPCKGAEEAPAQEELSIIVAFRGTNSFANVMTDARISMQGLREDSQQSEAVEGGRLRCCGCWRRLRARRSLQPLEGGAALELPPELPSELPPAEAAEVPGVRGSTAARALLEVEERAEEVEMQVGRGAAGLCCRGAMWLCGLLLRLALALCFPFLPPSDFEEDDEGWQGEATLARVRVHVGFSRAHNSVCKEVMSLLQERLEKCRREGRRAQVYITGHSMGGAIASLFALEAASSAAAAACAEAASSSGHRPGDGAVVYTFGSPRIGNAAFRSAYNALVPHTFRIVASRDLVPTLPPSIAYRQIGREVWLDDAGGVTFVMSWAMRHIMPARDSFRCHPLATYKSLLSKVHWHTEGQEVLSVHSQA